jgi:hypothetical protein
MLLLILAACAGKEDVPVADAEGVQTEEPATQEAAAEEVSEDEEKPVAGVAKEEAFLGPIGNVRLKDGSAIEISEFKKLGKYYLYISGKLNGRSSTVISLTRLRDVRRWGVLTFKDPHNFIITTKEGKDLRFLDSRIYMGSKSHDSYSFYIVNDFLEKELIEIKKADVDSININ